MKMQQLGRHGACGTTACKPSCLVRPDVQPRRAVATGCTRTPGNGPGSFSSDVNVNAQHLSLSTSLNPSKQLVAQATTADIDAGAIAMVTFRLKFNTSWGQGVKLIGSHPKLGSWSLDKAVELRWAEGDQWTASVALPAGEVYEYKYVVIDFGTKQPVMWQQGGNAVLAVQMSEREVAVHDNWGNNPGAEVRSDGLAITRENKLQRWAGDLVARYKSAVQENQQLAQLAQEGQAIKGELTRVKMELNMMQQAQRESDMQVAALKEQNALLQKDLAHARLELNSSFEAALNLLTDDAPWDEPGISGSDATGSGQATSGSMGNSSSSSQWSNGSAEVGSADSRDGQEQGDPGQNKWLLMMSGNSMNNISAGNGKSNGSNGSSHTAPSAAAGRRS